MGIRQDADELMRHIRVTEDIHRMIMEGREMKNKKKFTFRRAVVPAAAALLVTSTMCVGAGYVMERSPLRELFAAGESDVVAVPESQKMPDIYGQVMDSVHLADKEAQEAGGAGEKDVEGTAVPMGKYGELIMDNELFSIELLETTCVGRELSFSYILTHKTDERIMVDVTVEKEYYGELLDGPSTEPADSSRLLLDSGFGDSLSWKQLPEDCIYELEENQWLHTYTQLAKTDYASGMYYLYAEYHVLEEIPVAEKAEIGMVAGSSSTGHTYFKVPIEIISNDDYGVALSGTTDKTEGDVHFDTYEVYISPWTVYLTLDGTYKGEMDAIWGAKSTHEITIGFKDGTEAHTTVRLSGMGYGSGKIDVDMRASFDTAIDPESIVSVLLDGVVIMGE